MAKKSATTSKETNGSIASKFNFRFTKQHEFVLGTVLVLFSIALLLAFVSYFIYGNQDQSTVTDFWNRENTSLNWVGKFGSWLAHTFIYKGFGFASFIFIKPLFLSGLYLVFDLSKSKLKHHWFWDSYSIIVISIFLGTFSDSYPAAGGVVGYEMNLFLRDYIGTSGVSLGVLFFTFAYFVFRFNFSAQNILHFFEKTKKEINEDIERDIEESKNLSHIDSPEIELDTTEIVNEETAEDTALATSVFEKNTANLRPTITNHSEIEKIKVKDVHIVDKDDNRTIGNNSNSSELVIEKVAEEKTIDQNLSDKLVQDFGEFDHTLELSKFKFPSIELLKEYSSGGITINQEELEINKNKILDTLKNYNIEIAQIKATVGPSVTLYEIIPAPGIRISKIKNLEDDIALSLSALGIRIIAPIPGKGTIGIEVPNQKPTVVSMRSVISSPKFQNAEMELPIVLGKTISNETFVVDLAKMPHLLMAGATGQGKSVGLNAVLTSLLYKKHPAEVKFVLVDPKKVELTLYNKIERHYLAKLPDSEEAIITDNTKVINTLNSLCIEMDERYSLLKDAMVRNIKEYNDKFKKRKLNPENGHRFLPYIVLVVDEFADLIMTAGKEVETPIGRLAQLARAIGIHLIIATQRPSVNVITGIIKANFPARIAFRVTSKIDSRTILDAGGADQLIGRGDLLYTNGNDMVRVQCAFVDTPEVEEITEFIGNQKAYPQAYQLPEYVGEESSGINLDVDLSDRDALFREAAEVIVTAQQGSASLLQRKLKLGYNRAGRLIDQLEAAGIVGPFEGSKARNVLIADLTSLDQFFENENL